jgi:hypothetical protein
MAYDKVVDSAKLEAGLTSIADAIRAKTGGTGKLGLDAMAAAIPDVHAAGVQSEYDKFWDAAQQNGARRNYLCCFCGYGWRDENYNPKYPIIATGGSNYLFWNCANITDTKVDIHLTAAAGNNSSTFSGCTNLVTIRKLIIAERTTFSSSFASCAKLEGLTIEGVIGNDMTLSPCTKLTHDSLMSVINHLKDYSGTGTTKTMTLGANNLNKLTADEKKIATDKGWTLA